MRLPYLLAFNLTKACNLACSHCYLDADPQPGANELNFEEITSVFSEVAQKVPGTLIILTGGEPLLRADLTELVKFGKKQGLRMLLGSNGLLLTEQKAKELAKAGLMGAGISLLELPAESRLAAGAVKGIENAIAAGIRTQVHTTVTPKNQHQLKEFVQLAQGLGSYLINFFFLVCTGRGVGQVDLSAAEQEQALRSIARMQATTKGIMVQARCAPSFKRVLFEQNPESHFTLAQGYDGGGCLAGRNYARITPSGEVTACPYLEKSYGNLRQRGFWEIFSHLNQDFVEPKLTGRCGACEYQKICGGCRANALAEHQNIWQEDPKCDFRPLGAEVIEPARINYHEDSGVAWSEGALLKLEKVPIFLRHLVRRNLEKLAQETQSVITPQFMAEYREKREGELGFKFIES